MTIEEYFKDWLKVIDKKELYDITAKLYKIYGVSKVEPAYKDIFKAFTLCSLKDLKAVFIGQDVYPQKGVATGIPFGNRASTPPALLSPSLEVLKEAAINYTMAYRPVLFDITLESWARQGILMLNCALTTEVNKPGSHVQMWRPFITSLIENIGKYTTGIVYVLFGSEAQTLIPYIGKFNDILKERHPSYYARQKKRMPSTIFSDVNTLLISKYGEPVKWCEFI